MMEHELDSMFCIVSLSPNCYPYVHICMSSAYYVTSVHVAAISANNVHFTMSSFSETVALGYLKNEPVVWVEYP